MNLSPRFQSKPPPVPWAKILTSLPVLAIVVAHTLNNFGWYMLLVELPLFMRNGLGFNIKENALLSCIPFLCNWVFSIVWSSGLDAARARGWVSTTLARKISMAVGECNGHRELSSILYTTNEMSVVEMRRLSESQVE